MVYEDARGASVDGADGVRARAMGAMPDAVEIAVGPDGSSRRAEELTRAYTDRRRVAT
jgi:hypothetical protein